jgi:chemotaxis signal transduction protein
LSQGTFSEAEAFANASDAEAALLQRRAARLAECRDGAEPADELELLTFRLGRERFAVPVAALRGVVAVERYTRVPGAAAELLGVIYVRGEIVPLVDTGRLLHSPLAEGGPTRALLCRAPVQLAFAVDELCGIARLAQHELRPFENGNASRLIEALLPDDTALIRLESLLAAPALLPSIRR